MSFKLLFSVCFRVPHFKNWTGVVWNKTMVDELRALYKYQGKDAVFSVCRGGIGDVVTVRH